MTDTLSKALFPSLNQFLGLPEGNIDEELTNEQYFALVLAYNDKISGKKREHKKRLNRTVYELSDEEKVGLELAFKSGFSGNFSEEDVQKKMISLCQNEVCEVLQSDSTKHDKLNALHNIAVSKLTEKGGAIGSFNYYSKVTQVAEEVNGEVCKNNYKEDCGILDSLAELIKDPARLKTLEDQCGGNFEPGQMRERIEKSSQVTLENLYTHILRSVNCEVGFDAYNACHNLDADVQVG